MLEKQGRYSVVTIILVILTIFPVSFALQSILFLAKKN